MSINIICDACGKLIDRIADHTSSPEPKFYGQKLIMKQSMNSSSDEYTLYLHNGCANRIIGAIGHMRNQIKSEITIK